MASVLRLCISPFFGLNTETKSRFNVQVRSSDSQAVSSDLILVDGVSLVEDKQRVDVQIEKGNGRLNCKYGVSGKDLKEKVVQELEPFWDDGYGSESVKDYFASAKEMIKEDGAPPRWFCPVAAGYPLKNSPILLFLPGLDGTGWGLIMHHKALGKAFEVRCLHIPVHDRTPFEGLIKLVEETIKLEHSLSPNKPIYLVGDGFGGCLALAIAARNPKIDLVLILINPATSFERSQMQPFLPILEALPDAFQTVVPYILSFIIGDPGKMASVNIESGISPIKRLQLLSQNLTALLPYLSELANIFPKETLLWKLQLLKSAACYANSCLHAVKAEVIVLASGKDKMVPSVDEAKRLKSLLKKCTFRYFKDNGHTILLEDGVSLLTIVKGVCKYRRSKVHDSVLDFLPPSESEFKYAMDQVTWLLRVIAGSTAFSTLKDGTIVRGLAGVPSEGPVLLVGYHNLMGLELFPLLEEFLREKNIMVRGLAHPEIFAGTFEDLTTEFSIIDWLKVLGIVPVSAGNFFKLLSRKSHILLYPGGAREALHFKGEEYKLFWPDQPEFVRMAARFGATIVPFGAVGEDDLTNHVLDYNDLKKIPVLNDCIKEANAKSIKVRDETSGEVGNPDVFVPVLLPKIPGRMYYMFGKPVQTKGREEIVADKKIAKQLYLEIKSEVEKCLAYLVKKREKDPLRSIVDRTIYKAIYSPSLELPTFNP